MNDIHLFTPKLYLDRDKETFKKIMERIAHGESCAVVGMHGIGKDYSFHFLVQELKKEKLPYTIKTFYTISEEEIEAFLTEINKEQGPLLCIIDLRVGKDVSWFIKKLEEMRHKRGKLFITVIFSYVGDVYEALVTMNTLLTNALFIFQPVPYEDAIHVFDEFTERFSFPLTQAQRKEIYDISCGHIGLMRALYFLRKDYPEAKLTPEFLLKDPSILQRLTGIIRDMPYQKVQALLAGHAEVSDVLFFEKFGYVKNGALFNPLLASLIPKNPPVADALFSQVELDVFSYLKQQKDKLVTRSDIAKIIWGAQDWEDKYSEWALSQLMYRLRKKIQQVEGDVYIKTKKGEGFILLSK